VERRPNWGGEKRTEGTAGFLGGVNGGSRKDAVQCSGSKLKAQPGLETQKGALLKSGVV